MKHLTAAANIGTPCNSSLFAIKSIALSACKMGAAGSFSTIFALLTGLVGLTLAGCSALPDKPVRATMYDFGPGNLSGPASTNEAALPALAIDDIATSGGALDNMAVLYRLAYTDAQQLKPYSQARWSMPPAQLVRQRMRELLGQRRTVFNAGDSAALNRSQNAVLPMLLRIDLEEFSHLFTTPTASTGLIRLRVTLLQVTPAGEKLVGQRNVVVQRPADTADAPGGVRALTQATDAAINEIDQWLRQTPAR